MAQSKVVIRKREIKNGELVDSRETVDSLEDAEQKIASIERLERSKSEYMVFILNDIGNAAKTYMKPFGSLTLKELVSY